MILRQAITNFSLVGQNLPAQDMKPVFVNLKVTYKDIYFADHFSFWTTQVKF